MNLPAIKETLGHLMSNLSNKEEVARHYIALLPHPLLVVSVTFVQQISLSGLGTTCSAAVCGIQLVDYAKAMSGLVLKAPLL